MNEWNSTEIDKTNLTGQIKYSLNEISKIENYFIEEINQRKSCRKKLIKYVPAFDYLDNILVVLSTTSGGVSIISFTSIVEAPVGIARASFISIFSLATVIIKKLLSIMRNKKKEHDKILVLAKNKLSSTETLVSQALIDTEVNHEEFITILKEKDKYEKIKEKMKNVSEKQENMRLNSVNSKSITSKHVIG